MESDLFYHLSPQTLWRRGNQLNFVSLIWEEHHWITSIEGFGIWEAFTKLENREKNRSSFIPCWDHTRVTLDTNESAASDYIHANYVDGYEDKKKFICTQAPKTNTLNDFWRMVWSENSCIIVMLLNLNPSNSHSCCQYWPFGDDILQAGRFTIKGINVEVFSNWIVTKLQLSNQYGAAREVCHFVYTSWTKDAVPSDVAEFYKFVQRVNQMRSAAVRTKLELRQDPPGPIIVHCNTGIGRSGLFCAVDIALYQMMKATTISLPEIVTSIRQQRRSSVTTCEQYFFCYRVLLYFLSIMKEKLSDTKCDESGLKVKRCETKT